MPPPRRGHTPRLALVVVGIALCGLLAGCGQEGVEASGDDETGHRLELISAPPSPEDIISVPDTGQVVVSGLAPDPLAEGSVGHLYSIDAQSRRATEVWPDRNPGAAWDRKTYSDCPGPPDLTKASPHGINIETDRQGRSTLYVVNHGGREAVEVFRVSSPADSNAVGLTWVGCAVMPEATFPNGVAALPDSEGFVVSNFLDPTSKEPFAGMFTGARTGDVREWTPHHGWRTVPRSALGGANGIEVTPDGKAVIVAAWGEREVHRIPLGHGRRTGELARTSVPVPLKPDNLRWTDEGRLLLTGQDITEAQFAGCESGDREACPSGIQVLEIDPASMHTRSIFESDTSEFRVPTVAAPVGSDIWVGSVQGEQIALLVDPNGS